jgi:hypothetical protein
VDHYWNKVNDRIYDTSFIAECMKCKNDVANRKERNEKIEVVEQIDVNVVIQPGDE